MSQDYTGACKKQLKLKHTLLPQNLAELETSGAEKGIRQD